MAVMEKLLKSFFSQAERFVAGGEPGVPTYEQREYKITG